MVDERFKHIKRLADIACELDWLKNHLSADARDRITPIVISLHEVAKSEAGSLASEIYASDEGSP